LALLIDLLYVKDHQTEFLKKLKSREKVIKYANKLNEWIDYNNYLIKQQIIKETEDNIDG
jgi:hypothetical protein